MKKTKSPKQSTRWQVLLCLFFLIPSQLLSQTISSTSTGGTWKTASTWVGGIVPTASNSVVINGPVYVNGDVSCINLTINQAGSLYNDTYYNPTITVTGSLINNGVISNHPTSGYNFYLNLAGNIENNGVWTPKQTSISGSSNQNLKMASGKKFEGYFITTDDVGELILTSNVTFQNNTWDLNNSKIVTNGFKLTTINYQLNNGQIVSNDVMDLNNTGISAMTFNGDYKIDGRLRVRNDNIFNGTATILDSLHNDTYYNPTLTIKGKIINNGTIINHPTSGYNFYLDSYADIENNGQWKPRQTTLSGTGNQALKQSDSKSFQGYFLTTDTIGDVILQSDVLFYGNTWDLKNSRIRTNGFKLKTQNYQLNKGIVVSNETLELKNTAISEMTFNGKYTLDGKIRLQTGNTFNGTATIADTLHNDTYYNPTLTVNGELINNGKIMNHPTSGYNLYLNVNSNIENNGIWIPKQTHLSGKTDQKLKQASGKSFQGYFLTTDTIGEILLDSDVQFTGNTWDMNNCRLKTNGHNLITLNSQLNKGRILSNTRLILKNTNISEMVIDGTYELAGRIRIQSSNIFKGSATVLDTIYNDTYYNPTLTIEGDITNKGTISNHPTSGYRLYVSIFRNLTNNGTWKPQNTTFTGAADKTIKQSATAKFESYFSTTDTICKILLASDIMFKNNTWDMNKSKIHTNGHKLMSDNFLFKNGNVVTNDTLVFYNSKIADMIINGDCKVMGKLWIQNGNKFIGRTTVIDTLYNDIYHNPYLTFSGDLINNGVIANHPTSGYRLNLVLNKNFDNNKKININTITLIGTAERTISGLNAQGIQATVYCDNAITLSGNNFLPNLNFTGNPLATCTIKKDASLTLTSLPNASKIKNFGRISVSSEIDNSTSKTYNYYAASISNNAKSTIEKLTIDNYGNQQHPTASGTLNTWWRLRNNPQLFNDSLNWLKLTYPEDALNGNLEDSIKVFHSPNAGLTWKRIKKNFTIDKANNTVTITKAPSAGHYLLSANALGITSFQPLVESAEPRIGGNSGQLTMHIFGAGLKKNSQVKLRRSGQPDILADSSYLTDIWGESMLARFNLKNKPVGLYDVVIETSGEKTLSLNSHFNIVNGERSEPWSNLNGRDRFLIHRWQTFHIAYGNTSNTDALGTIMVYVVNDLPGLEINFPDINVVLPKSIIALGSDYTRYSELGLYYVSDSLSGYENQKMRIYAFYIPYIAAGTSNSVRVKVKLNGEGSLKMDSWLVDPLFEQIDYNLKSAEPIPSEVRACITAAAMKAWYSGMIGVGSAIVPGLGCWGVIDKVVKPLDYITPESIKPDESKTWGSWLWSGVSIMGSAVQCATSFVPVAGTALNLGIALVNTAIDMKDGYDATEGCWRKFRKKSQGKLNSKGVTSFDPNEIVGPQGFTTDRYISKEGNLNYTIYFENKKTAGASALEVFITDTLDVTKFDLSTFSFTKIAFADTSVKIQEFAKEFRILVDMYPRKNIIVQVHGRLDTITGIISWDFHSLDRITMELTEDPDLGFLAPNVTSPEGEGHVAFSCKLKKTVQHDDLISNRASIVFDFNKAIITNTFTNRIDDRLPVSSVNQLQATQKDSVFTVAWTGNDLGSKISKYHIFVSTNNSDYMLWKVASTASEAKFTGKNGSTYKFYSLATDSIGFSETRKLAADATTTLDIKTNTQLTRSNTSQYTVYPNPAKRNCTLAFNLKTPEWLTISVEDISGRCFKRLETQKFPEGHHDVGLNLEGIPDGMYFIRINNQKKTFYQKIMIKN